MLLKCCTQYASTFQNLSSGQRWVTWESQFSFQSQRKTVPKNIQTTIQLCLFYILAKLCFKSFKLGFSSMWTENFQMCKLGLEKAEEPELKLPAFVGSWRKQENSRKKKSTSTLLTTLKPLTVCVCVCVCARARTLSRVWFFATIWTVAHQAPLFMKFSRQVNFVDHNKLENFRDGNTRSSYMSPKKLLCRSKSNS